MHRSGVPNRRGEHQTFVTCWYRAGTKILYIPSIMNILACCEVRGYQEITIVPERQCRVKFWGVRGSTPTPQAENLRYGGNTSCVEVRARRPNLHLRLRHRIPRARAANWSASSASAPFSAHVFVSHFHWDHIQGMPFFRPLVRQSQQPVLSSTLPAAPAAWSRSWPSRWLRRIFPSTSIR